MGALWVLGCRARVRAWRGLDPPAALSGDVVSRETAGLGAPLSGHFGGLTLTDPFSDGRLSQRSGFVSRQDG